MMFARELESSQNSSFEVVAAEKLVLRCTEETSFRREPGRRPSQSDAQAGAARRSRAESRGQGPSAETY